MSGDNARRWQAEHSPASRPTGIGFSDDDGTYWRVSERDASNDPGARGNACLIFACDYMVRRVWEYPADWQNLSGDELLHLSWQK